MGDIPIAPWLLIIPAAIVLVGAGFVLARRDEVTTWNTDRRDRERRRRERRHEQDRRGERRLDHDERVHNPNRRKSDRREGERRRPLDPDERLDHVRERVEEIQHDNRNR